MTTITELPVEMTTTDIDLDNDWMEIEDVSVGSPNGSKKVHPATLLAGIAPSVLVGRLLFQWNRTNTTQFDATAVPHDSDLGASSRNAASALALSVVSIGGQQGNALRLTATALSGGGVFAVKTSELTLPARYIIRARIGGASGDTLYGTIATHFAVITSDFQGMLVGRSVGEGGGLSGYVVVDDVIANADGSPSLQSNGVVNDATLASVLGARLTLEVHRQNSANPASSLVIATDATPGAATFVSSTRPHTATTVVSAWDGQNHNRVGIGCWEGASGATGTTDIYDLAIYAHPDDA